MTIQTSVDDCRESGAGETSRRAFEDWAINQCRFDLRYSCQIRKTYASMKTKQAWIVWQASRAAIEIDLPVGGYYAGYGCEHMMESRDVREAIQEAGLKLKGEL